MLYRRYEQYKRAVISWKTCKARACDRRGLHPDYCAEKGRSKRGIVCLFGSKTGTKMGKI